MKDANKTNNKKNIDIGDIKGLPDMETWAAIYSNNRERIVKMLNHGYCLADREDAVEDAFDVLMHRRDAAAYGDDLPRTEKEWVNKLFWRARAYLSHFKDRAERHAKYVERLAKELQDEFVPCTQGFGLDFETYTRALYLAIEMFSDEQDVSPRDMDIYVGLETKSASGKKLAELHDTTAGNAYVIKSRVGELIRKYGPDCFNRALRRIGFDDIMNAA